MRPRLPGVAAPAALPLLLAVALLTPVSPLDAQEPPDTLVERPDTVAEPPDTVAGPPAPDTTGALPDSLRFRNLPRMPGGAPEGFERGVTVWTHADLMATPALTVDELLDRVPGMTRVQGGVFGAPVAATSYGLGGGRIRVYLDGFELLPMDGSVVDLARVGLAGIETVRLERGMGEIRIELESARFDDPRPRSIIEAGTGDLDTNFFKGTFIHPRAFGGSVGVGLERIDARGQNGEDDATRSGGWLRYTRHFGDRGGIQAEWRRGSTEWEPEPFPEDVTRTDWVIRGRWSFGDDLVAEAFTGKTTIDGPEDGLTPIEGERRQHGVRAAWSRGPVWLRGAARLMTGPDLPSSAFDVEGGGSLSGLGGAAARFSLDSWEGETTPFLAARAWSEPFFGFTLFGSYESGERGAHIFRPREEIPDEPDPPDEPAQHRAVSAGPTQEEPADPEPPILRVTDRTGLRVGAAWRWGRFDLSGAWLDLEADTLLPFGLQHDRSGIPVPGGSFTGAEVSARVRLVGGLHAYGSAQRWEEEARYLPETIYRAGLDFHDVFLESGNFELWAGVGVSGRDPMLVPFPDPDAPPDTLADPPPGTPGTPTLLEVPFSQSWDAYVEARIVTLHLLIRFENFTIRDNNQDVPGQILPAPRALYGIRWTLWN